MQPDSLTLLLILGAVNHQVAHILTVGVIFEDVRQWVRDNLGAKMGYLTTCHLCAGTWVGFLEAMAVAGHVQLTKNLAVDFALTAFTVALVGRLVNETRALMSSKVAEIRRRTEAVAPVAQPHGTDESEDGGDSGPHTRWKQGIAAEDASRVGDIVQEGSHEYIVKTLVPQDCSGALVAYELFPLAWERGQVDDKEWFAIALEDCDSVRDFVTRHYARMRQECA